jgi:HEAT repeat protein
MGNGSCSILTLVVLITLTPTGCPSVDGRDQTASAPQRRSIAELMRQLGGDDFRERQQAQAALIAEGARALPALRQAAKDPDLELARRARACIPVIEVNVKIASLVASLKDPRPQTRRNAGRALKEFGPRALCAVPALLAACDDADPRVREQATETLSAMGPGAEAAMPKLMAILEDSTQPTNTRWWAAIALGKIGRSTDKTVPLLLRTLQAREADLRNGAAHALGDLGPRSKCAIPALITLLKDPDIFVQGNAAGALGRIGLEPSSVVPALAEFLQRHRKRARTDLRPGALDSLEAFGPAAKASVTVVIALMDDENEPLYLRIRAVEVLGKMGPGVKEAVAALQRLAKDANSDLQEVAVRVLSLNQDE